MPKNTTNNEADQTRFNNNTQAQNAVTNAYKTAGKPLKRNRIRHTHNTQEKN